MPHYSNHVCLSFHIVYTNLCSPLERKAGPWHSSSETWPADPFKPRRLIDPWPTWCAQTFEKRFEGTPLTTTPSKRMNEIISPRRDRSASLRSLWETNIREERTPVKNSNIKPGETGSTNSCLVDDDDSWKKFLRYRAWYRILDEILGLEGLRTMNEEEHGRWKLALL